MSLPGEESLALHGPMSQMEVPCIPFLHVCLFPLELLESLGCLEKSQQRTTQSIVMNIHAMKVYSWKCNGQSTTSALLLCLIHHYFLLPKIPKGVVSCLRQDSLGSLRIAKLARKFTEPMGKLTRHRWRMHSELLHCGWAMQMPCWCWQGKAWQKKLHLGLAESVLVAVILFMRNPIEVQMLRFMGIYMFTVIPFLSHINVRNLFGLNIF